MTGVFLHIKIQRGKNPMNEMAYSKKLGATTACTLCLIEGAEFAGFQKEADRMKAKVESKAEVFVADSWFGSVKAAEAMKTLRRDADGKPSGHKFIGAVKTSHKNFPKKDLEETMQEFPSESHLVLECQAPSGVTLLAVGYKYNARKVLCFVATKDAGTTKPGNPYVAKFPDPHGNVMTRDVIRPSIISTYFESGNKIDRHNHARQYWLKLEKHWVAQDPWFRICTTIVGMTVIDAWLLARFQSTNNDVQQMKVVEFADHLASDLIANKSRRVTSNLFLPASVGAIENAVSPLSVLGSNSVASFYSVTQLVLAHKLVNTSERADDARLWRRRCFGGCGLKVTRVCDHEACRLHMYTVRKQEYRGKYFCSDCHVAHREEIARYLSR